MSAQKLLVLLVCSAAAVLAAGQQPKTQLFADWLDQKKPGKAGLSSYYSAAEVQDVCMREHKVDGCSCYGRRKEKNCCWSGNVDTDMTCCHDKSDKFKKLEKMTEEVISTGKCSYTQAYLEKAVKINDYDDSVMKVGTFSGICTLNKDSDVCGDPACDGMSVTIQGDILKAENVAFEGKPVMALRSDSCEKLFKGDCDATPIPKKSSDAAADATKSVRIASYGRPYENYEPKYRYGDEGSKYGKSDSGKYADGKYGVYHPDNDKKYSNDRKHDDAYGKRDDGYGKHDDGYGKHEDSYGKRDDGYDKREEKHEDKYYSDKRDDGYKREEKHEDKYYEEPKHEEKHEDKYYEREEKQKHEDKHSYDGDYEDKKGRYYKGKGEVFMGTFYTVNRIHDTKSYSGVYQSVVVIEYDDKYMEYAPEGAYVARPNEVYFRFVKSGSEPYKS